MNCSEVKELLHPLADGELEPNVEQQVRLALADCEDCTAELDEIEAVRTFAREAFLAPVEDVDLSGVFDGVMARLDAHEVHSAAAATSIDGVKVQRSGETPAVAAPERGLLDRISAWFGKLIRFETPMASLAAAAAAVAMVVGIYALTAGGGATPDGLGPDRAAPVIAGSDTPETTPNKKTRRAPELEQQVVRGAASVESYEVADGRIVIEGGEDDQPVVVWHLDEDEAAPTPDPEL